MTLKYYQIVGFLEKSIRSFSSIFLGSEAHSGV